MGGHRLLPVYTRGLVGSEQMMMRCYLLLSFVVTIGAGAGEAR